MNLNSLIDLIITTLTLTIPNPNLIIIFFPLLGRYRLSTCHSGRRCLLLPHVIVVTTVQFPTFSISNDTADFDFFPHVTVTNLTAMSSYYNHYFLQMLAHIGRGYYDEFIKRPHHFPSGMKVKADRGESSPYAAMLAAQDVSQRCKKFRKYESRDDAKEEKVKTDQME